MTEERRQKLLQSSQGPGAEPFSQYNHMKVTAVDDGTATVELELAQLKQSVALQVRRALDELEVAAETMKALEGTVSEANRLLEMANEGYELGVKTRLEVEEAQLNLLSARGNFAQAERDYRVARVYLEWISGTLGE